MPLPDPAVVFAAFPDSDSARTAVTALVASGFSREQIELTAPEDLQAPGHDAPAGRLLAMLTHRQRSSETGPLAERLSDLGAEVAEASEYERRVRAGQTLVSLVAMRRASHAAAILAERGGFAVLASAVEGPAEPTPAVVREAVRRPDQSSSLTGGFSP